jgi:hypothetical protein
MRIYSALRVRTWILTVGVIILIAGHGIFLYFASHVPLSAAVVSGAIVLVVIKHLGLLGPVYALLRRARRSRIAR